jgi:hypothetical protein
MKTRRDFEVEKVGWGGEEGRSVSLTEKVLRNGKWSPLKEKSQ